MKAISLLVSMMFVTGLAFANDAENTSKETVDHSKNPITGTQKTVKKSKHKMKDEAGNEYTAKVTDTTKEKKDGTVEHKKDVETDAVHK